MADLKSVSINFPAFLMIVAYLVSLSLKLTLCLWEFRQLSLTVQVWTIELEPAVKPSTGCVSPDVLVFASSFE